MQPKSLNRPKLSAANGAAFAKGQKGFRTRTLAAGRTAQRPRRHDLAVAASLGPVAAASTLTTAPTVVENEARQTKTPNVADEPEKLAQQVRTKLEIGAHYLPHPDKVHYGGEDAHFVSDAAGGALGVADGVGGWADSGVNPAEYSRTLMKIAKAYLEGKLKVGYEGEEPVVVKGRRSVDPQGALDAAHKYTRLPGSATACVLQVCDQTGLLTAANVGDSGFVVVRSGAVVAKSKPLQHFFDCPLQLGAYPEYVEATDSVEEGEVFNVELQHGDVILAGTDGLWDNCYEHEFLPLLPSTPEEVAASAERIAQQARKNAADPEYPSPYTRAAVQEGYDLPWYEKIPIYKDGQVKLKELTGGKMDDITVVVAMVRGLPLEEQPFVPPLGLANIPDEQLVEPPTDPALEQSCSPSTEAIGTSFNDVDTSRDPGSPFLGDLVKEAMLNTKDLSLEGDRVSGPVDSRSNEGTATSEQQSPVLNAQTVQEGPRDQAGGDPSLN